MVLPDSGISDIVPDDATFWGAEQNIMYCFLTLQAFPNNV